MTHGSPSTSEESTEPLENYDYVYDLLGEYGDSSSVESFDGCIDDTPPSRGVQRSLAESREKAMREVRRLFHNKPDNTQHSSMLDIRWLWMRLCLEFFPVAGLYSSYRVLL